MATISVSDSGSPTLREAINAAGSADVVALAAGTYSSVRTLAKQTSITPAPTPGSGYVIDGFSQAGTIIEDTYIYQYNTDGDSPGVVQDLTLRYSSGSSINGEYLLNVAEGTWTISNVLFTGILTGSSGGSGVYMFCRGGNPPGPYKASSVTLDAITVELTGQSGFNGTSGGSSFIQSFFNSGSITINGSTFDESGYRNAFTILSTGSGTSTGATITGNTFKRTTNQTVRSEGETIIDTTATVSGNTFSDGSYLQLGYAGNTSSKTVTVTGNTFNTVNGSTAAGGAANVGPGLVLVNGNGVPDVSGNFFKGAGTAFRYVSVDGGGAFQVGSYTIGTGVGFGGANAVEIGGTSFNFFSLTSGGQNKDSITGGANNEWLSGDADDDTINGGGGDDFLYGGDAFDAIAGGNDVLDGGIGNDIIRGGVGNDTATGGVGADKFFFQKGDSGGSISTDEITDFDSLSGDMLVFSGASGSPVITSLGSNAYSFAVTWADSSTETFKIVFSNGFVPTGAIIGSMAPAPPPAPVSISSAVTYALKSGEQYLTLTGSANINGTGNELDNRIEGNSGRNSLSGLAGNDTLIGGLGVDSLLGGDGDDVLVGAQNDALLDGGGQLTKDILQIGANFNDASNAQIANIEEVVLTATGLALTLNSQTESLSLRGFAAGSSTITAGSGNDTIIGGIGNDSLSGAGGNDSISAGDGLDTLVGGIGNDVLSGEAGADSLVGGAGADTLTGGSGADSFTYTATSHGGDTITDFNGAEGDTLRFRRSAFGNIPAGTLPAANFSLSTATGTVPQFIYNAGQLIYDSNGTTAGGASIIATLTGAPTLTAANIVMF